jgi:methionyl-tRNA formyltransferase
MSVVPSQPWRVVLFTDFPDALAFHLVDDTLRQLGHRIAGVVTTPGPKRNRSADYLDTVAAIPPGIDTIVGSHPKRFAAMVAPMKPDLIISAGFRWELPADLLAVPRYGAINLHPSLLPRHRGPHPLEWTFRAGDTEAGFSVHELAAGFDTGPILSQATVPVEDDDDIDALVMRMMPIVPGLIAEAIARLARGERGWPQDNSSATYAGKFEDSFRTIDWTRPARDIHNQVRSWSGMRGTPAGAFGSIDGFRHTVLRTRLVAAHQAGTTSPGNLVPATKPGLFVQCGDGPIEILVADPPVMTLSRGEYAVV